MNKAKENYEKKMVELEQIINNKNQEIENLNMNIEEHIKKNGDQIFRYEELNKEYLKLTELSKEQNLGENTNLNNNEMNIKKSFSELLLCLNKYKEILPFINKKLETLENENKSLKEQIKTFSSQNSINNIELIKNKEKENGELKKNIEKNQKEKEDVINKNYIINAENELIKKDIVSMIEFYRLEENKKVNENIENKEKGKEGDLIEELFNQLIKARNLISFLSKEK